MKILAIGDVFGRGGRNLVYTKAAELKKEYSADFLIINCENASGGSGVSEKNAKELLAVNEVDIYTSGNHIFDKRDVNNILQETDRIIRPANYPSPCPGVGWQIKRVGAKRICVINLSGTTFMDSLENPFLTFDTIYQNVSGASDIIVVDFHAEATSEKIAFGYYVDGRASVCYGTHTHVPTADERVLEKGCGFITDLGMTGPLNGVIGVDKDIIVKTFLTNRHQKFEVAEGILQLNGALFTLDDQNKCVRVERVRRIFD